MKNGQRRNVSLAITAVALGFVPPFLGGAADAFSQDLASVVAKAREQVENGAYPEALRTLSTLPKELPPALAVEAGLLETTAAIVSRGEGGGATACAKAVIASGYDPEVARDQSPKVRAACRVAAEKARKDRLAQAGVNLSDLTLEAPSVAWQPVRISTNASATPPWLRVVARVRSSALEGSFDLPLAPSPDGPMRGTIDPSFMRPKTKIEVSIVAQDKFGDLAVTDLKQDVAVPAAEAMVSLGDIPSAARVFVDDKPVEPDDHGHVAVEPGKHEVEMQIDGASASTKVEVARGSVARVALSPQKSGGRTFAWIATGTAVALGAVGGVMLVTAASRTKEIEELAAQREPGTNLPATDYAEIKTRDDERRTFSTVGAGLAIGGGVVGALAITLWLLPSGSGKKAATKAGKSDAWTVMPYVAPSSVGVFGTF